MHRTHAGHGSIWPAETSKKSVEARASLDAAERASRARGDALREAAGIAECALTIAHLPGMSGVQAFGHAQAIIAQRILALIDKPKGGDANASGARDASKTIPATSPGITAGASAVEDDLCKRLEGKVVWSADGLDCIPDNTAIEAAARIRSLSSRVERAEQLAYTGAISLASIDEDAPRPETWKERAENRQAVFLLAKRRAEAAESEAAALREALRPFAKAASDYERQGEFFSNNIELVLRVSVFAAPEYHNSTAVQVGDLRRARTALEGRDNG